MYMDCEWKMPTMFFMWISSWVNRLTLLALHIFGCILACGGDSGTMGQLYFIVICCAYWCKKKNWNAKWLCQKKTKKEFIRCILFGFISGSYFNIRHICREFHFDINIRVCNHPTAPTHSEWKWDRHIFSLTHILTVIEVISNVWLIYVRQKVRDRKANEEWLRLWGIFMCSFCAWQG